MLLITEKLSIIFIIDEQYKLSSETKSSGKLNSLLINSLEIHLFQLGPLNNPKLVASIKSFKRETGISLISLS